MPETLYKDCSPHNLASLPHKDNRENGANGQKSFFFLPKRVKDFLAGHTWQYALSARYCGKESNQGLQDNPMFKGSECLYRFLGLRALHTTRSRGPVRHRSAGDGAGHQRSVQPLAHLSIVGPVLLV
jgi:hypothetical protein